MAHKRSRRSTYSTIGMFVVEIDHLQPRDCFAIGIRCTKCPAQFEHNQHDIIERLCRHALRCDPTGEAVWADFGDDPDEGCEPGCGCEWVGPAGDDPVGGFNA